jgi:tetratricopeptide (TPR) repeat protein
MENSEAGSEQAMNSQRLWVFRLITFVLLPALLLGILESGARLFAPGYSTDFMTEEVVDGTPVRRENGKFTWQFFPAEIAREPLVFSFPTEKATGTYRIFVLGASAAQGDPEPSYGFSRILEAMLEHRYPEIGFEIINTAVTAINSHAVYPIAREVAPLQGDLFIIYLGNNEVVGPYGAGTVFAPLSSSLPFIRFRILLESSHLVQSLSRLFHLLQPAEGRMKKWKGMEMFLDQQVRADDPGMEKVYEHFRANLEDILSVIHRAGAQTILSTVGTNLRDSAPFASQHRHSLSEREKMRWDELYRDGVALLEDGLYREASVQFLEAEKIDDSYADLHFLLGRCYRGMGDHPNARRSYLLARDLDTLRFRADSRINETIRDLATDGIGEGVYLVDAEKDFEAKSSGGIPGDDLFYEHVHMNFKGNYLLANSLFQQIEKILPLGAKFPHEERSPVLTLEESRHRLALTEFDQHRISKEVLERLGKPPFTNQLDHGDRSERAKRREEELRGATTRPALLDATRQYEKALRENDDDPWLHHNFGMLHYTAGKFAEAAEQFKIFLAQLPHHSVAKERFLSSLIHLGRFAEAVDQCREALRVNPDFHAARYTLAAAFSQMGRAEDAIAIYRELLKVDPDRAPDVYNELGRLHIQQAQYAEAAEAFKEGIRIGADASPGRRPDMHFNLGVAMKRDGKMAEATQAFSESAAGYLEAIQRNPGSARLYFELGGAYVEMREFHNAAKYFRMAAASDPSDLRAHIHLAKSLEVQGLFHEAIEALKMGAAQMLLLDQSASIQALQSYQRSLEAKIRKSVPGG